MITTPHQDILYKGIAMFILFLSVAIIVVGIILAHELPYKIAKRRGHPQQDAIRCMAVMGLLLFPLWLLAMVWAYMRSGVSYFGGKHVNDDESSTDDAESDIDLEDESKSDDLDKRAGKVETEDSIDDEIDADVNDTTELDENEVGGELSCSKNKSVINKDDNIGN